MFENHIWHTPPTSWSVDEKGLHLVTAPKSDFWSHTFYGFVHTNGHLFGKMTTGDFSAEARFTAAYEALYDQAGAMLRVDDDNWLKAGIEFTDGLPHFSTVLTRAGHSDWSVIPLPAAVVNAPIEVRLTRHADALRVQYRWGEAEWAMARLGYLDMPAEVSVGPMACSPVGEGLAVTFETFAVGAAIPRDLHG